MNGERRRSVVNSDFLVDIVHSLQKKNKEKESGEKEARCLWGALR
jgi:hypothetical protein